jgi:FimV-like protein
MSYTLQAAHIYFIQARHFLHTHDNLRWLSLGLILVILASLMVSINKRKQNDDAIDFTAIAGDNIATTQLDLAKAYIEMGQKPQAKKILKQTCKTGNPAQKDTARQLLKAL